MSNYPPGVTGNEPQITGEWPCDVCGGCGYDEDEDGKHSCFACQGTGIVPEDNIDRTDVLSAVVKLFKNEGWGHVDVDTDDNGYLIIYTNLFGVGGIWVREDS